MTFSELLQASIHGLPKVEFTGESAKLTPGTIGVVTNIKDESTVKNKGYKGCAVRFNGWSFDNWFYAEDDTDRRSFYMRDLKVIQE